MARRFIVDKNNINELGESQIEIFGAEVKHIQVLRHKVGDKITVNDYLCEITKISKDSIIFDIVEKVEKLGEPRTNLTLFQAYLKSDKMELVVQKQVELGIKNIIPFLSKNVVVKLDEKYRIKKQDRLQKIADEACKQCGRTDSVKVGVPLDYINMLNVLNEYQIVIFAYEKETNNLKEVVKKIKDNNYTNIAIIVGAEGGFDKKEAEQISSMSNVDSVSLGQRILRAETASMYLTSILSYEMEQ